jgi:hypothetical protein
MTIAYPHVLSMLVLVGLVGIARGDDRAAPIRDEAGLFHAEAIARAEQRIADIHRKFDRRLFVQTVASASPKERRLFRFLGKPQVNRLLEEQARRRGDEVGMPGVYVVICNKPRDVHVIVRPDDDTEFTERDAETLRRTVVRSLNQRNADAALLVLVEQVQNVLQAHLDRGDSSAVNDGIFAAVLGGGLTLWLLLCLIRRKIRSSGERTRTENAALLGAMFGSPAGVWIYDKLYPVYAVPLPPGEPEQALTHEKSVDPTSGEGQPTEERAEDVPVAP